MVSAAGEVVLESLVQPTRRIPADAIAIHGITNADVKDAPAWCDLYEDLLRVLAGRRVIVYNVIFDRQMVNQACERYHLAAPAADWECAMRKYAGFYGNWDSGKRWYRFQKLERAVLAFGAEPGGHRAAADAFACRAVVLGMAATAPPMPATSASSAALDANRPWHVPGEQEAASPGDARGATPAQPGSPRPQPVDAYTRWARAVLEFVALLDAIPAELRERPAPAGRGQCGSSLRTALAGNGKPPAGCASSPPTRRFPTRSIRLMDSMRQASRRVPGRTGRGRSTSWPRRAIRSPGQPALCRTILAPGSGYPGARPTLKSTPTGSETGLSRPRLPLMLAGRG